MPQLTSKLSLDFNMSTTSRQALNIALTSSWYMPLTTCAAEWSAGQNGNRLD